jgi:hypothetical protein
MFLPAVALLQILGADSGARGEPVAPPSARPDTTYGRLEGDVGLVAGVGMTVGPRSPRAAAELRVRYLDTAGLFATYEDGALFGNGAEPLRVLAGGLELRPLFLGRWLTGRELGVPRLDLALDSIGIELGGFLAQPQGASFGQRPGLEVGIGLELPFLEQASGPWIGLHGGIRFSDAALGGGSTSDPADQAFFLSLTLAWHATVGAHAVDPLDRAPR